MGEAQPQTLEMYVTETGRSPFEAWLRGLRDDQARARIRARAWHGYDSATLVMLMP